MLSIRPGKLLFSQKNACEIFHDEAMSPGFRLKYFWKSRARRVPRCSFLAQMRLIKIILLLAVLTGGSFRLWAAEAPAEAAAAAVHEGAAHEKEEGLTAHAVE